MQSVQTSLLFLSNLARPWFLAKALKWEVSSSTSKFHILPAMLRCTKTRSCTSWAVWKSWSRGLQRLQLWYFYIVSSLHPKFVKHPECAKSASKRSTTTNPWIFATWRAAVAIRHVVTLGAACGSRWLSKVVCCDSGPWNPGRATYPTPFVKGAYALPTVQHKSFPRMHQVGPPSSAPELSLWTLLQWAVFFQTGWRYHLRAKLWHSSCSLAHSCCSGPGSEWQVARGHRSRLTKNIKNVHKPRHKPHHKAVKAANILEGAAKQRWGNFLGHGQEPLPDHERMAAFPLMVSALECQPPCSIPWDEGKVSNMEEARNRYIMLQRVFCYTPLHTINIYTYVTGCVCTNNPSVDALEHLRSQKARLEPYKHLSKSELWQYCAGPHVSEEPFCAISGFYIFYVYFCASVYNYKAVHLAVTLRSWFS